MKYMDKFIISWECLKSNENEVLPLCDGTPRPLRPPQRVGLAFSIEP